MPQTFPIGNLLRPMAPKRALMVLASAAIMSAILTAVLFTQANERENTRVTPAEGAVFTFTWNEYPESPRELAQSAPIVVEAMVVGSEKPGPMLGLDENGEADEVSMPTQVATMQVARGVGRHVILKSPRVEFLRVLGN